ncbi:MAG: helix-turn-helix transcriptional regulator [Paludibacteraceae bacterium]|nr:helix-turn-helix transcriptional regulator [Paludibacteraceae bacterium]
MKQKDKNIPLLDCPVDYLFGDASGKIMNEYGRFPCKIKCGVFALLVRGTAQATINITKYTFHENDALVLDPGSFMLIHECSQDALVYYLLFSSDFLDRNAHNQYAVATSLRSPIVRMQPNHAEVCKDFYALMLKAADSQPSMLSTPLMVHVFNMLCTRYEDFLQLSETLSPQPIDRKVQIYQDYCQLVLKHYHEWHRIADYADALHCSVQHICSTIKAASGRTAGDIITDAILTDAKAQLKITSVPLKEIAMNLGFENVPLFNRFFKTHLGVTPTVYRNS